MHDLDGVKDLQGGTAGLKLSETRRAHRSFKLNSRTSARTVPVLTLEEYFPEHLQYIRDILVENENTIADAINTLDCRADENKLATLYSLSRVSGILAARTTNLKKCQTLQSFGDTTVVGQCRPVNFDFRVDVTSTCGPQPRGVKWSISLDGYVVLPYIECLWKGAVVNFRGDPYKARNSEWVKVKPTSFIQHKVLPAYFKEEIDLSGALLNAAMEKEHSLTFNLRSQLEGTMKEHGVGDIGTLVTALKQTGQIPELFSRFRLLKWTMIRVAIIFICGTTAQWYNGLVSECSYMNSIMILGPDGSP